VEGLQTRVLEDGSERVLVDVRTSDRLDVESLLSQLASSPDVRRIDLAVLHSVDLNGQEQSRGIHGGELEARGLERSRSGIQRVRERL
jgi:hypothetical protein